MQELVGTCSLFFILESDNVWNLLSPAAVQSSIAANFSGVAEKAWMLPQLGSMLSSHQGVFWLCALFIVPTVWAKDVQSLSFLGLCGFVATCTVSCAVAYTLMTGGSTSSDQLRVCVTVCVFASPVRSSSNTHTYMCVHACEPPAPCHGVY